jgi:phosphoribosyl-AMP cyclohydrolase
MTDEHNPFLARKGFLFSQKNKNLEERRKKMLRRKCILPDFEKRGGLVTALVVGVIRPGGTHPEQMWDVLMVASVNETAYRLTLETGFAHFYSQSRRCIWKKGETSGNCVPVFRIRLDCDRDAVIYYTEITPKPVKVCHLGEVTCFRKYAIVGEDERSSDPWVEYSVSDVFASNFKRKGEK